MKFTVVGAGGFIGKALADRLNDLGHAVERATRSTDLLSRPLGHLIYAAGVTADFRTRPAETVEAHVTLLSNVLCAAKFDSLLYLSSTRVYGGSKTGDESAPLSLRPEDPEDLYNASKALGECLCLARPEPTIRVARLSNVVGSGNTSPSFFETLLKQAHAAGRLRIESPPASAKDYISLADVVSILPQIATQGRQRLYNVASGVAVENSKIAELFEAAGVDVEFGAGGTPRNFPTVSIRRLREEFQFSPEPILPLMRSLIGERLRQHD